MLLNLFIDVQQDRDGEYINSDVEGLETGTTEELARLLAYACSEEEMLKPIIFKSVAVILFKDGHISDQDLVYYLEAVEEGNYIALLDVMQFMER